MIRRIEIQSPLRLSESVAARRTVVAEPPSILSVEGKMVVHIGAELTILRDYDPDPSQ